jgi:hypothetical protein
VLQHVHTGPGLNQVHQVSAERTDADSPKDRAQYAWIDRGRLPGRPGQRRQNAKRLVQQNAEHSAIPAARRWVRQPTAPTLSDGWALLRRPHTCAR